MATDTQKVPTSEKTTRPRALVTGASSGIGEEFAKQLAANGYDIVLVARRRDRLERVGGELTGASVEIIESDLSTQAGVDSVIARIKRGDINMLVNNAGFGTNGDFSDLPLDREMQEIDLNVRALTQLCHAALAPMKAKHSGTIINVGSTGSYQPVPYMATYAATKAYVLHLSEALHEEAKSYGVNVSCLCPGLTKTEFHEVAGVNTKSAALRSGWATPASVVKTALGAAKSGSAIAVPGTMNKGMTSLNRFFPRFMVRKIAGAMFKKNADQMH
ncbi:MAG: SDR family oxidoreductase [Chloroflexota bacterium]